MDQVFQEEQAKLAEVEYSGFLPMNDEISADIAAACKDTLERIHSLEEQIQRTPVYNFLKRNNLRRQLQEATRRYTEEARARLDALTAEKEAEMARASEAARAQQAEAESLSRTVEAAEREIAELQSRQRTLHNGMTALLNSKPSDTELPLNYNALVSMDIPEALVDGLTDHERLMANRANQEKRLTDLRKQIGIIEGQMLPPYGDDIAHLEQCETEVARLKPNELYRQVFRRALTGAYRRHGVTYTRTNYRHKLYLTLRFCTLYYSRPRGVVDSYLNIDEAQDISMVEYGLLREILGNKCVFNLYGDINQALFPEKCVMDWEELREIVGQSVYVLNEDYRNTLQITEYCNRAFSAEIYPIGIKGAPVAELDWPKGVAWLAKLKKANPNYRAAVIVHREMETLRDDLTRAMPKKSLSWHSVDDAKVSVLTVEQAKGLEFEVVLVLSQGMEINEQYIAFTRALEHLCVVK